MPESLITTLFGAIAGLFALLFKWVRSSISECREDRKVLRRNLNAMNQKVTALSVETAEAKADARHAKDLAQLPCELPECPKRGA